LLKLAVPVLPISNQAVSSRIVEGRVTPLPHCYTDDPQAPVFLRAQNIEEGFLNFADAKRLTPEAFDEEPDPEMFASLQIPVSEMSVQQQIAAEVRRRREQARRLRSEAETDWIAAKRQFEEQLLSRDSQPIKAKSKGASAKLTQQTLR
jgi:hypothetical protein